MAGLQSSDARPSPGANQESVYREAATFIALGGMIIVLAHVVELSVGGPNWPAFAMRLVWFALLMLTAVMFRSGDRRVQSAGAIVGIFGSVVLDVAMLWVTGRSQSPLLAFTPVLAVVLPFVALEMLWAGVAGSVVLIAGASLILLADRAGTAAYVALLNAGGGAVACGWLLARAFERSRHAEARRRHELADAMDSIQTLQGLLPLCAWCRRVRSDAGYWEQIESYISAHSQAQFTHGLCPDCEQRHFPEFAKGAAEPAPAT
jgi:hypothetical protein